MAQDKNGKTLSLGDQVAITGTVVRLGPDHDFANIVVELPDPRPGFQATRVGHINVSQVEKIEKPAAVAPAPAPAAVVPVEPPAPVVPVSAPAKSAK